MQHFTLPETNPYFNYLEVMEPTIIRYTKAGRWYEMHRTSAMLAMFGIEKRTSFEEISKNVLRDIVYNFHQTESIDVTVEVMEENGFVIEEV